MSNTFANKERISSIQACEDMFLVWKSAYQSALKHDNLPPDTKYASFSEKNPFVQFVDKAFKQFCEMAANCAVHGYCGLSLSNRELYKRKKLKKS